MVNELLEDTESDGELGPAPLVRLNKNASCAKGEKPDIAHARDQSTGEENGGSTSLAALTTKTTPEKHNNTTLPLGLARSTTDRKDRGSDPLDTATQHAKHLSQTHGGMKQNDVERDHNGGQHPQKRKRALRETNSHGLMKRRSKDGENDATTGKTVNEGQHVSLNTGMATPNSQTGRARQAANKRKLRECEGKHENPRKRKK